MTKNLSHRPYDRFLHPRQREHAVRLRVHPDGVCRPVSKIGLYNQRRYPWSSLLLGDYFIAPLGFCSEKAMATGIRQAAARRDYEVSIARVIDDDGRDCLRVTLSAIGVLAAMRKAHALGLSPQPPSRARCKKPAVRRSPEVDERQLEFPFTQSIDTTS
jgi:hypothetical protein